ncbi:MAG: ABC transporter permease [Cuniculiplasma sp.]
MMKSSIKKQALIVTLPALLYFFIFVLYPIFDNVVISFETFNFAEVATFAGIKNYIIFFQTPHLSQLIDNTIIYTLAVPVIDVLLAIPLATLIKRINKPYLIPLILLPSFIPQVTSANIWLLMMNPSYGIPYYLGHQNIFQTAWSVVLVDVWSSLPLATLIIYSGLKSIPPSLEEATSMDGVRGVRKLINIDVLYIKSNILSAFVLMLMYGSFTFDPIYVLNSYSSPFGINDLSYFAYQNYYGQDVGLAAVIIIIVSILSSMFTLVFVYFTLKTSKVKTSRIWRSGMKFLPNKELPKIGVYIGIFLFILFLIGPIVFLGIDSIKPLSEIISIPPMFYPAHLTSSNYRIALTAGLPYFTSSIIASLIASIIVVFIGLPAAYVAARYKLGGLKFIGFVLFIYSLPTIIFLIPMHNIIASLGQLNQISGLIISYPVFILPLSIWMMYNFYQNFPKHVEEAANMDGMNLFRTIKKVIIPLSYDGMFVTFLYAFILAWGALIFPLALTYSPFNLNIYYPSGAQTVTILIGGAIGHEAVGYGMLAASSILSIIPSVILVIIVRNKVDKLWRTGGNVN